MSAQQITLPEKLHCCRCNWGWTPRKAEVRICPHCKSAYWDVPREIKKNEGKEDK